MMNLCLKNSTEMNKKYFVETDGYVYEWLFNDVFKKIIIMFKKSIAYLLSHMFFYIGDFIAWIFVQLNDIPENVPALDFFWSMYQRSMSLSSDIQHWAGNKTPWVES